MLTDDDVGGWQVRHAVYMFIYTHPINAHCLPAARPRMKETPWWEVTVAGRCCLVHVEKTVKLHR